jgi:hypothetical protein
MNPCEQKENIENLYKLAAANKDRIHGMEVRQVEIQGDVKHVKTRLDNGISHTIASLNNLLTKLEPVINHHARIVAKIEDIGWWMSKILIAAVLLIIVWAASNGWKFK